MVTVLTHNFPRDKTDNSGIFIKQLWDRMGIAYEALGYQDFRKKNLLFYLFGVWRELRRGRGLVIAYWIFPAGLLARLSGRPYILNCIGLDIFMISRSRLLSWVAVPILNRARELVFIGKHPMAVFRKRFGDRYDEKSHLLYFPVDSREFS
jgi:hypothetical protein